MILTQLCPTAAKIKMVCVRASSGHQNSKQPPPKPPKTYLCSPQFPRSNSDQGQAASKISQAQI